MVAIERAGELRFHCVGDTGGFHNPVPQRAVAAAMATELAGEEPARFFYHLGDIVYLHGERAHYRTQFFEPYAGYGAPIIAIAGNHDGDVPAGIDVAPLEAFVEQFCSPRASPWHRPRLAAAAERLLDARARLGDDHRSVHRRARGRPDRRSQLRWLTDELMGRAPA